MIIDELSNLLRRKQQLDQGGESGLGYLEGQYTQRQRWLSEAVEALLRIALENEKRERHEPR